MDAGTRRFVRVSGSVETVLGYAVERWRDAPGFWIGVLHPDDRERVASAVWRLVREGAVCEIEYRAIASDGSIVRLRDRVRRVQDEAGTRLQGSTIDVGERIRPVSEPDSPPARRWRRSRRGGVATPLDSRLQFPLTPPEVPAATEASARGPVGGVRESVMADPARSPEPSKPPPAKPPAVQSSIVDGLSFDLLVERAGEAVVASDSAHRIVVWNPAAELLFGWAAADAIGRLDHEVLAARTDSGQTAEIVAGLVGRRPWSAELTIRRRDGLPAPVRLTASALWSKDGTVAGYVAVITDLREVRERAVTVEAAAAMDAVARLARAVARELSDGLTRVDAAVRTALARLPTADPVRGLLDDALRSVDAASAMATQLHAVGRDRPLVPAVVHLADVIERSLPALRLLAGPEIEIALDLDPGAPPVRIDPSLASQLVLHLAANGCGAMHDRGRLDITVRVHDIGPRVARRSDLAAGSYVVLEVRDTRDTLPAPLEKAFEPLAEPGAQHAMGLAAAHGLVTSSGGRILAEPASGGGLLFRVFLRPAS